MSEYLIQFLASETHKARIRMLILTRIDAHVYSQFGPRTTSRTSEEVNRREVSMYQPISSPTDERPSATSTASRHLLAWLLNRSFVVDIRYATYRRNKFATKLRELVKDRDRACWRVTVRFHADQALLIAQSLRIYYRVLDNCIRQLLLGELNDYRDYVRNRQFTTRSVFLIDQIEISPLSLSTDVAVINLAEHHQ